MFRFDERLKFYLHRDPVDFRYGMNSLSIFVEQSMQFNPMDSSLYIFGNRRRDRIKILFWDGSGFWLMIKGLVTSHFIWPDNKAAVVTMTLRPYGGIQLAVSLTPLAGLTDDNSRKEFRTRNNYVNGEARSAGGSVAGSKVSIRARK